MVNPGEIHDGSPIDQRARSWKMLYFDPKLVAQEVEEELRGELPLLRPVVCDIRLVRQIGLIFARLCSGSDSLAVEESLLHLLIYLFRQHGAATRMQRQRSSSVRKAIQRLDQAPELSVSLSELAALTGLSRFQFLRSFAREVGITPHAYLMQRRILLVRRLLAKGCGLSEASLHAGFADQSHMTRTFVRQTGITPARYAAAISHS
jgi:AraC-like DNA-binding protein